VKTLAGLLLVVASSAGCNQTTEHAITDAQWQEQLERTNAQIADYDRQTKKVDEIQLSQVRQNERFDKLLDAWEKQAVRQDAVLDAMEKQYGVKK